MTTSNLVGAASGCEMSWHSINWSEAHQSVRRLQTRIAKAVREGRWGKVKSLQWLLTHSFHGKAIAVKRVTENQGKNTPGVDGETWNTPGLKTKAVMSLKRKGYKTSPMRRVFIPKANGKQRPLGIPTMKDRAMQALHLLALEPISETTADLDSYGFRPLRACRDAAEQCFTALSRRDAAQWVLDADISGCFDNISHDWLISKIPMDKEMLRKWLKAGFIWNGGRFGTAAGTPQGGIISPVLANMTLDGLQSLLLGHFGERGTMRRKRTKVSLIRYADDFVVTGTSKEVLEEAKTMITVFLAERGLVLSPEKTKIVHIDEGFDFLGWNVRKYGGKLLIKPSKNNVTTFLRKTKKIITSSKQATQESLIYRLNPVIKGWANYHRHQVAKDIFNKVDHVIWQQLWWWCTRRHPNKSKRWIKEKYFPTAGSRNWVFGTKVQREDGSEMKLWLAQANDVPIRRHVKIKREANPYDPAWEEYFEERLGLSMKETFRGRNKLLFLWHLQEGKCPKCSEAITKTTGWHLHRIVSKADGGTDSLTNLELLHPNCHRKHHNLNVQTTAGSLLIGEGFVEA